MPDLSNEIRCAAFVTHFHRPHTMQFLDRVLRNLCEFPVARMHVTIVTNTGPGTLAALTGNYFAPDHVTFATCADPQPPQMLTWMHKPLLAQAERHDFTHFLYLEDDIGLTAANFRYFLTSAPALQPLRLIPGFCRTEFYNGTIYSVDAPMPTVAPRLISVSGKTFAVPDYPFCGCFVMDRALLQEYIASPAFDVEASKSLCDWRTMERAAAGLVWHAPPPGHRHRYVLPVNQALRPLACCQVPHMPNSYAPRQDRGFGKLEIGRVFMPGP